jgi:hypothetical protein
MAVLIQEDASARKTPALKGYRIHEDQVRDVARYFREMYQVRQQRGAAKNNSGNKAYLKEAVPGCTPASCPGRVRWVTGTERGPLIYSPGENTPDWKTPGSSMRAIHCSRCGTLFPLADFLYTGKSGLCIDCWEAQVI